MNLSYPVKNIISKFQNAKEILEINLPTGLALITGIFASRDRSLNYLTCSEFLDTPAKD